MEVLTLQLGHFANYIGAHFWNIQEEIAAREEDPAGDAAAGEPRLDFERLYRRCEHLGEESWRPRLVLADLRGALGPLQRSAEAAPETVGPLLGASGPAPREVESPSQFWDHSTVSHCAAPLEPHPFQQDLATAGTPLRGAAEYDFRNTARSWTDYQALYLREENMHELHGWQHGVSPFAVYFDGLQIHGGGQDEERLLDLTRLQFEACDRLDAVHLVFDMHNGFGGVADVVLRWVQEEQAKCGKLCMAVQPEDPEIEPRSESGPGEGLPGQVMVAERNVEACSWVSAAFSFAALLDTGVDVWTPLAVPLWSVARRPSALTGFCQRSAYESSALLAAALETMSLPYRLHGGCRPSEFLATLAPAHRPACGLLQALPLPSCGVGFSPPWALVGSPGQPGMPAMEAGPRCFLDLASTPALQMNPYASLMLRGVSPRRLVEFCKGLPMQARQLSFAHHEPLPLPLPFPQAVCRGHKTRPDSAAQHDGGEGVSEACPTATHLHAVAGAGRCVPLQRMASLVQAHFSSSWAAAVRQRYGVEADEFRQVFEVVTEHLECGGASSNDEGDT